MNGEPASKDLIEAIQRHGRTVCVAEPGSEEWRYLEFIGAETNVGGDKMTHILLRPRPRKSAVLEEFLHGTQFRLGIVERLGVQRAEIHVKDFMIRHGKWLGLSEHDIAEIKMVREFELQYVK